MCVQWNLCASVLDLMLHLNRDFEDTPGVGEIKVLVVLKYVVISIVCSIKPSLPP